MTAAVVVEKKKKGSHVTGENKTFHYDLTILYHEILATMLMDDILTQYRNTWGTEHEDSDDLTHFMEGSYTVDQGDFTYTITMLE